MENRLGVLENSRESNAEVRGRTEQRLEQIHALAETNRAGIASTFRELDDKLQRELNLADETLRSQLIDLDRRLQSEIAISRAARADSLTEVGRRLDLLEAQLHECWTRSDQANFESQSGLSLKKE